MILLKKKKIQKEMQKILDDNKCKYAEVDSISPSVGCKLYRKELNVLLTKQEHNYGGHQLASMCLTGMSQHSSPFLLKLKCFFKQTRGDHVLYVFNYENCFLKPSSLERCACLTLEAAPNSLVPDDGVTFRGGFVAFIYVSLKLKQMSMKCI